MADGGGSAGRTLARSRAQGQLSRLSSAGPTSPAVGLSSTPLVRAALGEAAEELSASDARLAPCRTEAAWLAPLTSGQAWEPPRFARPCRIAGPQALRAGTAAVRWPWRKRIG
jgi:hypothetical protein